MPERIKLTNSGDSPKLIWIEPFGVPVTLVPGASLCAQFECDRSGVQQNNFGHHIYLGFPSESLPYVTTTAVHETVQVCLQESVGEPTDEARNTALDFRRMIDHLRLTIKNAADFRVGDDCAEALRCIGSVPAIDALFCAYHEVNSSLAESLQPRIIYWLNLCKYDTSEKRSAGMKRLKFLHALIAAAPDADAASCRRAFYILSKLNEKSDETMTLAVSAIEQMAGTTDHEWKVTRDAAILFVEKRSPGLLRRNVNLKDSLRESSVFDPMLYCSICNHRFSSKKQFGDICPECGFEFGVDDAAHYKRPKREDR